MSSSQPYKPSPAVLTLGIIGVALLIFVHPIVGVGVIILAGKIETM